MFRFQQQATPRTTQPSSNNKGMQQVCATYTSAKDGTNVGKRGEEVADISRKESWWGQPQMLFILDTRNETETVKSPIERLNARQMTTEDQTLNAKNTRAVRVHLKLLLLKCFVLSCSSHLFYPFVVIFSPHHDLWTSSASLENESVGFDVWCHGYMRGVACLLVVHSQGLHHFEFRGFRILLIGRLLTPVELPTLCCFHCR